MRLLSALLAFLAAGCSPLVILNAAVPDRGFTLQSAIAYGDGPRQRLDVYRPDAKAFPGARPVIFFLYGGGWQSGERTQYKFAGQALASRGFLVVIPDYRVYPEVRYPEFVRDAARAFAWTHREAARLGGDATHIVVMGHSAGAHIGAMLAYNERFLREVGLPRSTVHGFIGLAGPYDFKPEEPVLTALLSGEGDSDQAMPARFVHGGEPPSLLLIGDDDNRVGRYNQERLAAKLRAAGSVVDARVLEGFGDPGILGRIAAPIRDPRLLDAIVQFASR
jgi:acetyl esterase/lipase